MEGSGAATILSAIAVRFGGEGRPLIEVRIAPAWLLAQRRLLLLVDGQELTDAVPEPNGLALFDELRIARTQSDLRIVFTYVRTGLHIDCQFVTLHSDTLAGQLNCRLQVPADMRPTDGGLAGNWAADPTVDLRPPEWSGHFDPQNTSSIYWAYVNSHRITEDDSLFSYAYESFEELNTDLSPELNDEPVLNSQVVDPPSIYAQCGASKQCVFDARYTAAQSAANGTRDIIERVRTDQSELNQTHVQCAYPDVPLTTLNVSSLTAGGVLLVSGCIDDATDHIGGVLSCVCGGSLWNCDLLAYRCRCIGMHKSQASA